ncbi:hypothetical protein [Vreelandella arcis]|uniref:Cytochrome oxidase Cu insertion factor, SCO1/SenC/PrrC family n=1 Tax=Vreelandella arcis TaxID=416873 RepID=A0A1G9YWC6_9GAMM|nr:hypothetical protein [Halomonas arcis]SDN13469.1 hypothetical protein SAMN04487951_102362 [Halomonas arcis]
MVLNSVNRQRFKLMLLFIIFAAPILTAWGMVEWRVGVPQQSTANGSPAQQLPRLEHWPIAEVPEAEATDARWTLVFDCSVECIERQDVLWRMHRALGRDAIRLIRLRIGGEGKTLPGEQLTRWHESPSWRQTNGAWLIDPQGRPALSFSSSVSAEKMLDDIQHLFKVNAK